LYFQHNPVIGKSGRCSTLGLASGTTNQYHLPGETAPPPSQEKGLYNLHFIGQALVAHAFNPSYLGGRDWKDHGWRLAQHKVLKITFQTIKKLAWWHAPVIEAR
jgi:hypothetical protein